MTPSDPSYSDQAVAAGEALWRLYLSDAWPGNIERCFNGARDATANLARELAELDAAGQDAPHNQPAGESLRAPRPG